MTHLSTAVPGVGPTPLHTVHRSLGAFFTNADGWDMPLHYGASLAEHHAVRTSAGIFDLSHMGEIKVEGPGAGAALDFALVGRISSVAVGRSCYSLMVSPSGGIIDNLTIYHVGAEEFLVVANAPNCAQVSAELVQRCAGFTAVVTDISPQTALLAIQGPRAEAVLRGVVESGAGMPAALAPSTTGVPDNNCGPDVLCGVGILSRLRCDAAVRATAAGHNILLARSSFTGEDGFALFCGVEDAEDLWRVITESGAALKMAVVRSGSAQNDQGGAVLTACGLAAYDSLRLEAGIARYGYEFLPTLSPFDVSAHALVALDKPDFVGRQALQARANLAGQADTEELVALAGQGQLTATAGDAVLDSSGRKVGAITSGLLSPTLERPIALARLAPFVASQPAWPLGTQLRVEVGGEHMPMCVVATPFYQRKP